MDNKLSELSKPVATVDVQRGRPDGNMFGVAWSSAGHAMPDGPHFLYSQEYVSALLAELEATRKQSQELAKQCGRLGARAAIAERKLATPVRLPDVLFISISRSPVAVMHAERVKERIREAGFTVKEG